MSGIFLVPWCILGKKLKDRIIGIKDNSAFTPTESQRYDPHSCPTLQQVSVMNRGDNPRNHRTRWTLQELHYLEMNYGKADTAKIAEVLGRSVVSVRLAAKSFGCRKNQGISPLE